MITVLLHLLILVLILALIWWALSLLPLASPFDQIIRIILVIIFVVAIVYLLLPFAGVKG